MNRIAFIFSTAPHGSSAGREGLDALLATSALSERIGIFFVSDGVFQILSEQKPNLIFARNYIVTFKVLNLYNTVETVACITSMKERGLKTDIPLVLDVNFLSTRELHKKLSCYEIILTF